MTDPALFVPDAYRAADPAAIVRAYAFGLITTATAQGIHATSAPIVFERDDSTDWLVGHMARRNPHAGLLAPGQPVLIVFNGPHAYVSPRCYVDKPQVPTWDYVTAHVRGTLDPIDDDEGQRDVLRRTTEILEPGAAGWRLEDAPEGRVELLLPMIRSFRIRVSAIEGVTKLSQTHPAPDRARVVAALRSGEDNEVLARMIEATIDD